MGDKQASEAILNKSSSKTETDALDMTRGVSLVNLQFTSSKGATYCCGTPLIQDDKIVCPDGDEDGFEVDDGDMIFGRGALANATAPVDSSFPTETAGSEGSVPGVPGVCGTTQCNDTAIGAGVGVPLGLIALASIAWAVWERRKARRGYTAAGQGAPVPWSTDTSKGGYQNQPGVYRAELQHPPVELGDSRPPAHQLPDTERGR
ncbi:hypothetical protein FQN54_000851 [Arachnomyces sp. PD_36]|nr:hypothetical protein FQN54_000851 [Arachnomyces sp. PD_36]